MLDTEMNNAANLIRAATTYMETLGRVARVVNSSNEADRKLAASMIFHAWRGVREAFDACDDDA